MKERGRFPRTKNAALASLTVLAASPLLIRHDTSVADLDKQPEVLQKVITGNCSEMPPKGEQVIHVSFFENDGKDFDLRLRDGTDDKTGETAYSQGDILRVNTETHTLQRDPVGQWGGTSKVTAIRTQEGNGEFTVTAHAEGVIVSFSCNK